MNKQELVSELEKVRDEDYREFHSRLKPSKSEVMGVRMAELRRFARLIAKADTEEFVRSLATEDSYEVKVIVGMAIFYSKLSVIEKISLCKRYVPFIDGWAVCDGVCSTIRLKDEDKNVFWSYISNCCSLKEEFTARFGLVAMRHDFIDIEHIDDIIKICEDRQYTGYYDSMAAAWLIADCMVKFPEKIYECLKGNCFERWVHNKSISKIRESYRISNEIKEELKAFIRE